MEKLKVSIGKTYNLGNYQSLRLDVGLEVEHKPKTSHDTEVVMKSVTEELKGYLFELKEATKEV